MTADFKSPVKEGKDEEEAVGQASAAAAAEFC